MKEAMRSKANVARKSAKSDLSCKMCGHSHNKEACADCGCEE